MSLDDNLEKRRVIRLFGEVTQDWWEEARERLLRLCDESDQPVNILIHSNGGRVNVGFYAHDFIRGLPNPIHTYGTGRVSSAALDIFLAGDQRFSLPRSLYHFHNVCLKVNQLPLDENFEARLAELVREINWSQKQVLRVYSENSKLSPAKVKKMLNLGDQLQCDVLPEEMVEMGFAHKIVKKLPWK